jgi:hypothetical protein
MLASLEVCINNFLTSKALYRGIDTAFYNGKDNDLNER